MLILYDTLTTTEALLSEALAVVSTAETHEFSGDVFDAAAARDLAACLALPPLSGVKVVVGCYRSALPRGFDILLAPLEAVRDDVHLLLACPGPYPETFSSRFALSDVPRLDQTSLFEAFANLGREGSSIDDLVTMHPHLPAAGIRGLYDEFMQGIGTVGEFVSAVHDGARESGLRMCLNFGKLHAGMLACELDLQLRERSLCRRLLTRVPRDRLLLASSYAETRYILPTTYAALVLHALT